MQQHRPQNSQPAMHYNTITPSRHGSASSSSRTPRSTPQSSHRPQGTAQSQQTQTQTYEAFRPVAGPQNNTTDSGPAYVSSHTQYQPPRPYNYPPELPKPLRAGFTSPRQPAQEPPRTPDPDSLARSIPAPEPSEKIENVVQAAKYAQHSEQRKGRVPYQNIVYSNSVQPARSRTGSHRGAYAESENPESAPEHQGVASNRGSEFFVNDPRHLNPGNNQSPTHACSSPSRNTEFHAQHPSPRSSAVANTERGDRQDSVLRSQHHRPGTNLRTQTQASSRSRHNTGPQTIPVSRMETNTDSDKEVVISNYGDSVSGRVSPNPFEFEFSNHLRMMAPRTHLTREDQEAAEFLAYTSPHALDHPGPLHHLNAANSSPTSSTSDGADLSTGPMQPPRPLGSSMLPWHEDESNRSPDTISSVFPAQSGTNPLRVVNTPAMPNAQFRSEVIEAISEDTVCEDNGPKGHLPIQITNHQENNKCHNRDSGISFALATQRLPLMSVSTNIQQGNALMKQGIEQAKDAGVDASAYYTLALRLMAQQAEPKMEEAAVSSARKVENSTLSALKDAYKKLAEAANVVVKGAQKLEHGTLVTVGYRDQDAGESFVNLLSSSFFSSSSSSPSSSSSSGSSSS